MADAAACHEGRTVSHANYYVVRIIEGRRGVMREEKVSRLFDTRAAAEIFMRAAERQYPRDRFRVREA